MTTTQIKATQELQYALNAQYPNVQFKVHLNYYTKLPAFSAIISGVGGFHFIMHKHHYPRTGAYIRIEFNATTKSERGMTVSHGFGDDFYKEDISRVNYKRYLEVVQEFAPKLAETIAVV